MRLVRAELLKLVTTRRSLIGYFLAVVAMCGLGAAASVGDASSEDRATAEFGVDLVDVSGFAAIVALLLGLVIVTSEWRHGTITPTLLATPRRERSVLAKLAAAMVIGAAVAVLAIVTVLVVALPWFAILGETLELGSAFWGRAGRVILAMVLWCALGAAVGAVVHAQVGAIVGAFLWILVAEPLVGVVLGRLDLDSVADHLPSAALNSLGFHTDEGPGTGTAFAAALAYLVVATGLGILRTHRRDVT